MNTGVKLPKFVHNFLNVYSIITLGIGFIVIFLVNSPYVKELVYDVEASTPFKNGEIVNACGYHKDDLQPGTSFWNKCDTGYIQKEANSKYDQFACGVNGCFDQGCLGLNWGQEGTCGEEHDPANIKGDCYVQIVTCDPSQVDTIDGHMACNSSEAGGKGDTYYEGGDATFDSAAYDAFFTTGVKNSRADRIPNNCLVIQIDVVCQNIGEPADDFVVWKGNLFDNFDHEEVCGGVPEDKCPYDDTRAKVRKDGEISWHDSLTITKGEAFQINSQHDLGGLIEPGDDTHLTVTGPDGFKYECDGDEAGCNGHTVLNTKVGTYTLVVSTYDKSGGFYPESECNDDAVVTVNVQPPSAVCGDTCSIDDDCTDGTTCEDTGGGNLMCLGIDWQECELDTHIENGCECPEEPDMCPYGSTEAAVQRDVSSDWVGYLNLKPEDSFNIGSFHENTGSFAEDTLIEVVGPDSFYFRCDTRTESDCNGHTVSDLKSGNYGVYVSTWNKVGGVYPEDECKGQAYANVTVTPPEKEKNFTIRKDVVGDTEYNVGEKIKFKVVIENTGDVVLDMLTFVDKYQHEYMDRWKKDEWIYGERKVGNQTIVQSKKLNTNSDWSDDNFTYYKINDLTKQLGDLGVGEHYVIHVYMEAIAPSGGNQAWNYAIADYGGKQKEDGAYIKVKTEVPIPPTDK